MNELDKKEESKVEAGQAFETAVSDLRLEVQGEEVKPEEPSISADEARAILNQIKLESQKLQEYVDRAERLKAENTISGKADAGAVPPPVDEDKKLTDDINKMLEGTGLSI